MTDARAMPWSDHRERLSRISEIPPSELWTFSPSRLDQDAITAALALGDRCAQAEHELAGIDAVMARRPALDLPSRRENIEKAISFARRTDDAERKLAHVQQRAERAEARVQALTKERDALRAELLEQDDAREGV